MAAGDHVARHRQHVAPLLERGFRRDERAALQRRLDDDDGAREAADDAIAQREMPRARRRAGRELADNRAAFEDLPRERGVLRRVDHVGAAPQNRDRAPRSVEGAAMGRGVHAAGQSADHYQTGIRQLPSEPRRDRDASRRRRPRADDRDRGAVERLRAAPDPQHDRRVRKLTKPLRITGGLKREDRKPQPRGVRERPRGLHDRSLDL